MKIRSFYMNVRKNWGLIYSVWNDFFKNLQYDYNEMKTEIDNHPINLPIDDPEVGNEEYLRNHIIDFIQED